MSQNKIELKSVGELIRSGNQTEHYLIPDYQRGYRWKAQEHIKALLEDIEQFMKKSRTNDEIYCLQPIVVVKQEDNKWEVIDGQQRLTSLYLILHYLGREKYTISYTHRENTDFLKNPEKEDDSTPDAHFITQAYQYIQKWFQEKEDKKYGFKDGFSYNLIEYVKVIWYEVSLQKENSYDEKINIFNRLNIGKIPLDDAELIRALFVQNVKAENEKDTIVKQSIFANEWIEIENFLKFINN